MSVFDKLAAKWLNKTTDGVPKEGKQEILANMKESIEMYRKLDNPNSVEFYRQKRLRENAERLAAEKERERIRKEEERQAAIDAATRAYESQFDNEQYLREQYEKYLRELREAQKNEERVRALAASQVGGTYVNGESDDDCPELENEEFNHEEKIRAAVKAVEEAQARVDKALQDLLNAEKNTQKALEGIAKAERMYRDEENDEGGENGGNEGRKKNNVVYYLRNIPQRKARPYTVDKLLEDEEKAEEEQRAREEAHQRALEEAEWSDRKREREAERKRRHEQRKREKEELHRQKEEKKLLEKIPEYTPSEYNPIEIDVHNVDFKYINVVEDALERLEKDEEGPLIVKHHKKGKEADLDGRGAQKEKEESSDRRKRSIASKHSSRRSHSYPDSRIEEDGDDAMAEEQEEEHDEKQLEAQEEEHEEEQLEEQGEEHLEEREPQHMEDEEDVYAEEPMEE